MNSLSHEEAVTLLDTCPLAVLLLDASGQIRACNRVFAALTGTDPDARCTELVASLKISLAESSTS